MQPSFELVDPVVRDLFRRALNRFPKARFESKMITGVEGFRSYTLIGPDGSANLEIIVCEEVQHFEFAVGDFIYYEGDFVAYPASIRFLEELIDAATKACIKEKRFNFLYRDKCKPAYIEGVVEFRSFENYRYRKSFNVLDFLAKVCTEVKYVDYT